MIKKIAIAGSVGAAVLGVGAVAMAATGTSSPAPSGSPAPSQGSGTAQPGTTGKAGKANAADVLNGTFQHGEWVATSHGKDVTHDGIRGTVTAVSPTAISVKAADGFSQSYAVAGTTKVVERENGKGSRKQGAIADVKVNDHVLVTGTKNGAALSAGRVLDTGAK